MRLLVVEDEPVAAAVLAKGLREHAYAVDVAADGAAALESVAANDYDLLILDVLLPGFDGLELCSRLRATGATLPSARSRAALARPANDSGCSSTHER